MASCGAGDLWCKTQTVASIRPGKPLQQMGFDVSADRMACKTTVAVLLFRKDVVDGFGKAADPVRSTNLYYGSKVL